MTLEKAREQLTMHSNPDSDYNWNACLLVSGEFIREHDLEKQQDLKHGIKLKSAVEN